MNRDPLFRKVAAHRYAPQVLLTGAPLEARAEIEGSVTPHLPHRPFRPW